MDYAKNLAENISNYRKQMNMTQEMLGEKLGLTFQAVSKWENGLCCPDVLLLPELAAVFGVTLDELFGLAAPVVVTVAEPETAYLYLDLPWENDRNFYAAVFQGHKLLENSSKLPKEFRFIYEGEVGNVTAYADLTCGDVRGDVTAGCDVTCASVQGNVKAGCDVTCSGVNGDIVAGCDITCTGVAGNVSAGGDVHCADVNGRVEAGGDLTCGNVGENVTSGGDLTCGDVGGSANAGGDLKCKNINGIANAGGDLQADAISGSVHCGGDIQYRK